MQEETDPLVFGDWVAIYAGCSGDNLEEKQLQLKAAREEGLISHSDLELLADLTPLEAVRMAAKRFSVYVEQTGYAPSDDDPDSDILMRLESVENVLVRPYGKGLITLKNPVERTIREMVANGAIDDYVGRSFMNDTSL